MLKTTDSLYVHIDSNTQLEIPHQRMATMLKPGDIIFVRNGKFGCSGERYIITSVMPHKVFAVPDPAFIRECKRNFKTNPLDEKRMVSIKYQNIKGILFVADETRWDVSFTSKQKTFLCSLANQQYPQLKWAIMEHPDASSYLFTWNELREFKRFVHRWGK